MQCPPINPLWDKSHSNLSSFRTFDYYFTHLPSPRQGARLVIKMRPIGQVRIDRRLQFCFDSKAIEPSIKIRSLALPHRITIIIAFYFFVVFFFTVAEKDSDTGAAENVQFRKQSFFVRKRNICRTKMLRAKRVC